MSASGITCRYYLRGICRFGDTCRFSHTLPEDSEMANSFDSQAYDKAMSMLNVKAEPFVPKSHHQNNKSSHDSGSSTNQQNLNISTTSNATDGKSYAEVVGGAVGGQVEKDQAQSSSSVLCPYEGNCPYGDFCGYLHAELCDLCEQYCLHPTDKEERRKHINECIDKHERAMELSFAIARSQGKTCGVCFDIILEKTGREQRFGILPNCNHVFCLECIRKWRQAKQFEHKITRACPECRTPSDYVCPSPFWVDTKEEKDKLLTDYKAALKEKDCKYFNKGDGKCPFGNKCFYKHALPNGLRVDVGLPHRHIRKLHPNDDELLDLFDIYLWDFVEQRNYHWFAFDHGSDSEDSDWSAEYD